MTDPDPDDDLADEPTPWTFRIMLILGALYLLWRLIQGVLWLWNQLVG